MCEQCEQFGIKGINVDTDRPIDEAMKSIDKATDEMKADIKKVYANKISKGGKDMVFQYALDNIKKGQAMSRYGWNGMERICL